MSKVKTKTEKKVVTNESIKKHLKKGDGELSRNEENISRMLSGTTISDSEPLDMGEDLPLSVQEQLTRYELSAFHSNAGALILKRLKIYFKLKNKLENPD